VPVIPSEFSPVQPSNLPQVAGVVLACCPQGDAFQVLAAHASLNIRAHVEENAISWASNCAGYLRYFVFVSNDERARLEILKRVTEGVAS
jgi:hypothetical protein